MVQFEMAESSLSLTITDLQAEVGSFLGWGMGSVAPYSDQAWTTFQAQRIKSNTASGLRRVYWPVPDDNGPVYNWSFLHPVSTLTFVQGQQAIPLPDDFGGVEGEITLLSARGLLWLPIRLYNEGMVRDYYTRMPTTTGRPQFAAVTPLKGTSLNAGQRFQLLVWPLPDANYPFQVSYYVNPDFLDGARPFPLGGVLL